MQSSHSSSPSAGPPSGQQPRTERDRLLRRVQADAAQLDAEVQRVRGQSRRLLEIEATRPLTPDEVAQARTVTQQANVLRLQLQQLRAEFAELQGQPRRPRRQRAS